MSNIPSELRFTEAHEWVSFEDDGLVRIGITDHAQTQLGDLVFVELPEVGSHYGSGDACAVVESVKAASDIYAPLSGEVIAVNETLLDKPELINSDSYGDGWLFCMRLDQGADPETLMGAEDYQELLDNS